MSKMRLAACAAVVAGVFLALASTAIAEFSSLTKSAEGETIAVAQTIEGGGVKIACLSTTAPATWVVESGSKPAEKGSQLITKIKTWGECSAAATGIKGAAKGSECQQELKEPGKEASVTVSIVTTCTFTMETTKKTTCEVKLEAASNKELKEVLLYNSGEKNVNLDAEFNVSGVTTTVNEACKAAGVEATKTATIAGAIEEKQVMPGRAAAQFTVGYAPNNVLKKSGEKRKATINNGGGMAKPGLAFEAPAASKEFWGILKKAECEKTYNAGESCITEVELLKERAANEPFVWSRVKVTSPGGETSTVNFYA